MSSSSALTFRIPSRDNFAQTQAAERKAATKVTVKPYVVEAPKSPTSTGVKGSTSGAKVGVHLDAKA